MKVGLVGFSGSGKSTVFEWLTEHKPDHARAQQGQVGVARIADPRLDWLSSLFNPKKTTFATLEFLDTPGLMPTERRDNPRRLGILREAGGLVVVLNGHSEGGDLAGQLRRFREELTFADLEIVTNRIGRVEDQIKKPRPAKEREAHEAELKLLQHIQVALEKEHTPGHLSLREDEEKSVRSFQLLTLKPEMVLVNCDGGLTDPLPADLLALSPTARKVAPKLEMELRELSEEEQKEFMTDMGLGGFQRDEMLRSVFYGMGQIVFFTVGEDECRAWPMPKGADAVVGAGQIHTDLARTFVRAEVVSYADFQKYGSMKDAKQHGVYRLEGKTYLVQDGDVMHILASG
jgi:ribosome-binding ATPase YchF (GTP1/OBG family)